VIGIYCGVGLFFRSAFNYPQADVKTGRTVGWKTGSVDEFLNLTAEESAYIQMKLALSQSLRKRRLNKKLSQIELARLINASQSWVAKMEAGDLGVSIDLIMKSLLVLGALAEDVAKAISSATSHTA